MTTPNYSLSQQAYAQSVGVNSTNYPIISTRDPNQYDVLYQIGKFWINTLGIRLWYLNNQSNSSGQLLSKWELISTSSVLASLSDTNGTIVYPSIPSATPPDNIQFVAGSGISIIGTPSSTSPIITISSTAEGLFNWVDVSGVVTAQAFTGYFVTGSTTSTLPSSPIQGTTISYVVDTNALLTIQASGTQQIRIGLYLSIAGGTCANTVISSPPTVSGASISLVYRSADTTWFAVPGTVGTWVIT
jgi:hypothetical protein